MGLGETKRDDRGCREKEIYKTLKSKINNNHHLASTQCFHLCISGLKKKSHIRQMSKQHYKTNTEKMRVHARRYYDAHREEILLKSQKKRDLAREAEGRPKGVHRKLCSREFPTDKEEAAN